MVGKRGVIESKMKMLETSEEEEMGMGMGIVRDLLLLSHTFVYSSASLVM